jgi:Flp pilus assembly protein TadG
MIRIVSKPRRSPRRGVAAVELAVLLPFLCFLFVTAVDFARIFYLAITSAGPALRFLSFT